MLTSSSQVNRNILSFEKFKVEDAGGTIVIHTFGAYFGLAVAKVLGPPKDQANLNSTSGISDILSLIGTIFLWLFWPSFNGGAFTADPVQGGRAITNTVVGLLGSCTCTFMISGIVGGKLSPADIQNATLAGGVSIGATANLPLGPGGALLVGVVAGAISTYGFCCPLIGSDVDTCGINNLHGMPGILGGLVSAAVPLLVAGTGVEPVPQLIGLAGTLVVSCVTGFITGKLLAAVGPMGECLQRSAEAYNDVTFWDCADDIKQE